MSNMFCALKITDTLQGFGTGIYWPTCFLSIPSLTVSSDLLYTPPSCHSLPLIHLHLPFPTPALPPIDVYPLIPLFTGPPLPLFTSPSFPISPWPFFILVHYSIVSLSPFHCFHCFRLSSVHYPLFSPLTTSFFSLGRSLSLPTVYWFLSSHSPLISPFPLSIDSSISTLPTSPFLSFVHLTCNTLVSFICTLTLTTYSSFYYPYIISHFCKFYWSSYSHCQLVPTLTVN